MNLLNRNSRPELMFFIYNIYIYIINIQEFENERGIFKREEKRDGNIKTALIP